MDLWKSPPISAPTHSPLASPVTCRMTVDGINSPHPVPTETTGLVRTGGMEKSSRSAGKHTEPWHRVDDLHPANFSSDLYPGGNQAVSIYTTTGLSAGQVEQVPSAGPVGPAAPGRQGGSTDHLSGGQREHSGSPERGSVTEEAVR
ncbi:hypothetical protein SKAU_G00170010 [Synaphobranchus kaupii]|uniref:Uncharacterized protein n=1 Tax=Synaphobranchus kaupii TaxID=118154 RepID=A0A9Q1FKC8_SYNKA|nr:hypothetical protein SKAU_G00170010 [Synaphobranchus kaupii]